MDFVKSEDGTRIAYERDGVGAPLVLVGGAMDDGAENAPLASALASTFTVFNYARRGRGDSGDTTPYAVAREIEDLGALLTAAGGAAHVFGASSGAALALRGAAAGLPISKLAVYDVPYDMSDGAQQRHAEYVEAIDDLLAQGRRGDAFAAAMRTWGAPAETVEAAKQSPMWPGLERLAHTLAYDAACMGTNQPPPDLATIARPTLVLTGEASQDATMDGLPSDYFGQAARAVAGVVPTATVRTVPHQGHVAEPAVLAPILERFFAQ